MTLIHSSNDGYVFKKLIFNYRSLFYKTHVTPVCTSLHQFAEGLKLFGVLDAIKESPDIMRTLFTMSGSVVFAWKVEDFLSQIDVVYSPHGSNLYMKEVDTYKYFCDVVEQLSIAGKALQSTLYFKFFTISMQKTPTSESCGYMWWGSENLPSFLHCLPFFGSCGLTAQNRSLSKSFFH